jgi:hypothetical protein
MTDATHPDRANYPRSGHRQHASADVAPELYAVDAEGSE